MTDPRDSVYAALFAKARALQGAGVFKTVGRRLFHWSDVEPTLCPALFQAQVGEKAIRNVSGLPPHWRLDVLWYVYVFQASQGASPSMADSPSPAPLLNVALDAVEGALRSPAQGSRQTLGLTGVENCFIDGDIKTDEGTLGDRAVAIVPIVIVTTSCP